MNFLGRRSGVGCDRCYKLATRFGGRPSWASEQEELRLTVSVDDQATAKLVGGEDCVNAETSAFARGSFSSRPMRTPCRRRSAKERDELASVDHSTTSSSRSMIDGGMASPSAVAVFRFRTISNFVGNLSLSARSRKPASVAESGGRAV
jgi:hypothetical protein